MTKRKLRNAFEKKLNKELKKSGVEFGYETTTIPYVLACSYIPDFTLHTRNGLVFIEAKGYLRPEHKRKMAAVKRQHPEKDIRIVFYSKNKKYIKWSEKNGIKYAIGSIPKDWLEGL